MVCLAIGPISANATGLLVGSLVTPKNGRIDTAEKGGTLAGARGECFSETVQRGDRVGPSCVAARFQKFAGNQIPGSPGRGIPVERWHVG